MPVDPVELDIRLQVDITGDLEKSLRNITEITRQASEFMVKATKIAPEDQAEKIGRSVARATENMGKTLSDEIKERMRGIPSIDSLTKFLEASASSFIEQFLVSVGGARARWGYWRIFLEIARALTHLGLHFERSNNKNLRQLSGLMFFMARLTLMTVGIITLIKHLVFDTSRISGYMSAVSSLIRTMYVMIFMPIANMLGAILLPVLLAMFPVVLKLSESLFKLSGFLAEHPDLSSYLGSLVMGLPFLAVIGKRLGWGVGLGAFALGTLGYGIGSSYYGTLGGLLFGGLGTILGSVVFGVLGKNIINSIARVFTSSIVTRVSRGLSVGLLGSTIGTILSGITGVLGVSWLAGKFGEWKYGGREGLSERLRSDMNTLLAGHETLRGIVGWLIGRYEKGGVLGTMAGGLAMSTLGWVEVGRTIANEINEALVRGIDIKVDVSLDGSKVAERIATEIGGRW